MGGSRASRQDVTSVTTTTETNIGEIGFTGDDAVALAAILEQGSINRDALANDALTTLAQTYGSAFNQLVAGAGNLNVAQIAAGERALDTVDKTIGTVGNFTGDLLDASIEADRNRLNTATDIVGQTRALAQEFIRAGKESQQILTGQETDSSKVITVAGVVIVAAFGLYAASKR